MEFSLIGNGSWATAIAKILTDNGHYLHWWMRKDEAVVSLQQHHHNYPYLSSITFDPGQIHASTNLKEIISSSQNIIFCIPSAYIQEVLDQIGQDDLRDKWIISAIKGILPKSHVLLNDYLGEQYGVSLDRYISITGPCHAEEIALERLSYLTFSCQDLPKAQELARVFRNDYVHTIHSEDSIGTQYASVLKNIYALGAGIAHGLGYGDNFISVYVTRCFEEMCRYLSDLNGEGEQHFRTSWIRSAYLGDLLVTCYSLHSRNRRLGSLLGQGYSLESAVAEIGMVAEGYYASQGMHIITQRQGFVMPVMKQIYSILWDKTPPEASFKKIETLLG